MENFSNISKKLLTLFILATFLVTPLADILACDDCLSPSGGKGVDARHFCPLCFTLAGGGLPDYNPFFEKVSSLHWAISLSFLEPAFPINKPPKN